MSTHQRSNTRRILNALVQLVQTWWRVDRIRVSPREGRLLRLSPGTIVSIDGNLLVVGKRSTTDERDGLRIIYACQNLDQHSELWVSPANPEIVVWLRDGHARELGSDDVEIWDAMGGRKNSI